MVLNLNNNEVTGVDLNGTEVSEVRLNGQTVFSAGPNLPVAFSDLVAWYPFDSGTYGGANADDVTAIIGGSGDDTAYDGTVNGATYQSTGGVTDINAGANSGYFDVGPGEAASRYNATGATLTDISAMAWVKISGVNNKYPGIITALGSGDDDDYEQGFTFQFFDDNPDYLDLEAQVTSNHAPRNSATTVGQGIPTNTWVHTAFTYNASNGDIEIYVDGVPAISFSGSAGAQFELDRLTIGQRYYGGTYRSSLEGDIDDARIYDKTLTSTEVSNIFNATTP